VLELAPYLAVTSGQVVKASKGHYPQPFLISNVEKNWCKYKRESFLWAKIFLNLTPAPLQSRETRERGESLFDNTPIPFIGTVIKKRWDAAYRKK
jgi:hypothetical protein